MSKTSKAVKPLAIWDARRLRAFDWIDQYGDKFDLKKKNTNYFYLSALKIGN